MPRSLVAPTLVALSSLAAAARSSQSPVSAPSAPERLDALLADLRAEHELPALAAAIASGGELTGLSVIGLGAVGLRRADRDVAVELDDLWHLGSCTKSMTATWIARCIESGELEWSTTLGEAFAELREAGRMHAGWNDVPIEWLLQNRGGAPPDLDADGLWGKLWSHGGTPAEQRRALVEGVLARPPAAKPGAEYVYSNAGFALAAAMVEELSDGEYEARVRRELFEPLGAPSFGFGAPGTPETLDEPRGHRSLGGELRAIEPGPFADNPSAIAPAGKAHASLADWAKYAGLHLGVARPGEPLLSAASLERLHAPALDGYAMGWVVRRFPWAEGEALWHNGSNTMWYCEIALFRERGLALLVASNRGDGEVRAAVGKVIERLYAHASAERER